MMNVEILTSPQCSGCTTAKRMFEAHQDEAEGGLEITERDVTKEPQLIQKYDIRSTPAIVIDGELVHRGVPEEKQVKDWLGA